MKAFILFTFLSFITFYINVLAQGLEEFYCPEVTVSSNSQMAQTGGRYKPSQNAQNEFFRILIVFAEFRDDNRSFNDWEYGQLPTYSNQIVDSVTSSTYRSLTLSDYWKTMSNKNFDIIGDVYPHVITLRSEQWYRNQGKYFQDANSDVMDSINGKIDFKRYDNWGLVNGSFVFNQRNGDGYLDMMYIIYRRPASDWFCQGDINAFGGIAILGYNLTYNTSDGVTIDGNYLSNLASGITIRVGADREHVRHLELMSHELGHYLFGGGHIDFSGLMTPGGPEQILALNGWERERLGYIAYTPASQDNFTITLGDYVTTGDILKIPIPNSTDNYFLVENHQRLNRYDEIMHGGSIGGNYDTTTTLGSGIYIWLIRGGNNYPPTIDIKAANGNWDWVFVDTVHISGWYKDDVVPLSGRVAVNRNFGKSDRHYHNIVYNNKWYEKWHDTIPPSTQRELTRNIFGLETHAFNYNYTRLFTPWSSPSSYVDGVTNLALQVYSQNGNNITLKVFNTYNSCLNLPPSKPQFLHIFVSPLHQPTLNWAANIEPNLSYYKIYKWTNSSSGWQFLAQTTSNNYTDISELFCTSNVLYKISAVNTSSLESVSSDQVSAIIDPMTATLNIRNEETLDIKGTCNLPKGISVSPGGTVNILPGSTLNVNEDWSIAGTVTAIASTSGGTSQWITFQPLNPTEGNWGHIIFSSPYSSGSILRNVHINNSSGIQCLNLTNVTIEGCNIVNPINGIYIWNSAPSILSNNITNPSQNAILGEALYSSPLIKDNSITYSGMSDYEGIMFLNGSFPHIVHNDISGFSYGLYSGLGSTCYLYNIDGSTPTINNRFRDGDIGIASAWGSMIWAAGIYGGNNTLRDNNCDAYVYQNSRITGSGNYWGPGKFIWIDTLTYCTFEGINSDLTTDPWETENSSQTNPIVSSSGSHLNKSETSDDFSTGLIYENSGRIDDAINFYKGLIANNKHVRFALSQLAHIRYKYSKSELLSYFTNSLATNVSYRAQIKKLLGDIYLQNDQFDNAMTAYDNVIANYSNTYDGINARFAKLFACLHIKNDTAKASQILANIKGINSNEKEVLMRIRIAENLINGKNRSQKSANSIGNNMPKNYGLSQNFPNPFNPSTTIRYQIPKPGIVTLKIYDLLGREVATLVNENKIEGIYDVNLNASKFPSGVYVYQLRVNDFVSSKKMIMLK